jgi:hypothetical protein
MGDAQEEDGGDQSSMADGDTEFFVMRLVSAELVGATETRRMGVESATSRSRAKSRTLP